MTNGIYWLASYPKSGNTWMRAFIANLIPEKEELVDINYLQTGAIASSRHWMDDALGFDTAELSHDEIDRLRPEFYDWVSKEATEDSYHKTHDAYIYLANGTPLFPASSIKGVIYILRNPLDVAISFAHHCSCDIDKAITNMGNTEFTFSGKSKRLSRQLRQRLLSWSGHVSSWVDEANLPRLVVRYEDMRLQPESTFSGIAKFLNLTEDVELIRKAILNCDFNLLQKQENEVNFNERPQDASRFFRKGLVGDWQETLSPVQITRIIADHGEMMQRFGYLDKDSNPLHPPAHVDLTL